MTLHKFGTLKLAGQLMGVSAVLHAIAPLLSGFSPESMQFLVAGVIYGLIALGLLREIRWLAYPTFLIALMGMIVAYAKTGASTIPDLILWALVLVDIMLAVTLFVQIWRRA